MKKFCLLLLLTTSCSLLAFILPTPNGGTTGEPCGFSSDCLQENGKDRDVDCVDSFRGFVDGYCTESCSSDSGGLEDCTVGIRSDGTTSDGVCVTSVNFENFAFNISICLDACNNNSDCREGYHCSNEFLGEILSDRVCLPFCQSDEDCDFFTRCNPDNNLCTPSELENCNNNIDDDSDGFLDCEDAECFEEPICLEEENCADKIDNDFDGTVDCDDADCALDGNCNRSIGSSCSRDFECGNFLNIDSLCIDEINDGFPEGYCSKNCDTSLNDCPAGSICLSEKDIPPTSSLCFDLCLNNIGCRDGYECTDNNGTFDELVCFPESLLPL